MKISIGLPTLRQLLAGGTVKVDGVDLHATGQLLAKWARLEAAMTAATAPRRRPMDHEVRAHLAEAWGDLEAAD